MGDFLLYILLQYHHNIIGAKLYGGKFVQINIHTKFMRVDIRDHRRWYADKPKFAVRNQSVNIFLILAP